MIFPGDESDDTDTEDGTISSTYVAESLSVEMSPETEGLATSIIEATATITDQSILDLEPLYTVIDPDALETLFCNRVDGKRFGEVSFAYSGCAVTVTDGERVTVTRQPVDAAADD
ncbi:hypothetical protein OB919_07265 [Halobacteria archaeon AArc-curdl1]|uniref:Halobacterial output domain-containing protein n=1 Tax=Natronosalvus hydrolyticus TaxID=2979988 RepID=A0AAP3E5U7_9EURY|nr:hypothetical protein [Halobacteria archaeon AArc-curdl1]